MKLTFHWPNNNTAQDNEFIVTDYSYTQCYYNQLLPADNYVSLSIPWDTETANKLRMLKDDNIKVVITDDVNQPVFTGYVDSGIDFTKTQTLRPIGLKLVSPSFILRQTVGETIIIKNNTVKSIVSQLLARLNIVSNSFNIPAIIPIVVVKEDEEYYDIIETLLFEYGYVFDFDADGKFTVMPVFDQPPANATQIFNGNNIRNMVRENCARQEYNYLRVQYKTVKTTPNDLVYFDDSEQEVPSGRYFCHENETAAADLVDNGAVFCEYQSSKGEIIWAEVSPDNFTVKNSGSFAVDKTGNITSDVQTTLGNTGTSFAFRAKNTAAYPGKIYEIKAVGTSYTGTSCFEVSKNGNVLKEYESRFLQDRSNAASFTRNLSNYYRYSSIKLSLESMDDFPYGSFVLVEERGIGQIKARIVMKTYKLRQPISYELESVTDFQPASITGELTYGNANANSSPKGPDTNPPTPPSGLVLSLRDDGKVSGSFTKSPDADIRVYTVYRKTPNMPYKTVLTLDAGINTFVDESAINGMQYTYRVIATDNSGNVSNPTNEAAIGTVTIGKPDQPVGASAEAFEDYINVTIVPPTLGTGNRDVYAPTEYKIQISRNGGSTYSDLIITGNTSYDYYFDRPVDGYPEASQLGNYRFKVFSVNIYGNLSLSVVTPVSTGSYYTWTPVPPINFRGNTTGRTCYLDWDRQYNVYGTIAYRIQVSLDKTNWYKPNTTADPYASENNYKEANAAVNSFLEITDIAFFQVVPLKGQNTDLGGGKYSVSPKTYYYRVMAINTTSGKSSAWSSTLSLEAKGTSALDILNNAVGWDQIIDGSILVEKLGVKRLIAGECTLAFIGNDIDVADKSRKGFQYWALDNITIDGTKFKKGEFRINTDTGDFILVDPATGITFKAARIDLDSLGANIYGNFNILDKKGSGGLTQFSASLVNNDGSVKTAPVITLGNDSRKPAVNLFVTDITISGVSLIKGFINLSLTNMNSASTSLIAKGSRVEAGGNFYKFDNDTIITDPDTAGVNYIYCIPNGSSASFACLSDTPAWDAVKGGWYNGNNRAVAKLYYTGSAYSGKIILDSYEAVNKINTNQAIPQTGGTVVVNISGIKHDGTYNLPPGAYRYSLTSGAGAGDGSVSGDPFNPIFGGVAETRDTKTGAFYWNGGYIRVRTGGDGFDGGLSGSGAGEESEIVGIDKTARIRGGTSMDGNREGQRGYDGWIDIMERKLAYGGRGGASGIGYGGGTNGGDGGFKENSSDGGTWYDAVDGAGGASGGEPGWMREAGGPGGSCTIWRLW